MSTVINYNSNYTKTNILTRNEAEQRFVQLSPDNEVIVDGDFTSEGNGIIKGDVHIEGTVTANELTATSDQRVKTDLIPVSRALEKVLNMNGYAYTRKDWEAINVPKDRRYIGLVAQEVQEVIPEVVKYDEDTDLLSINYPAITAVLIESIKDLYDLQMKQAK